MSIHKNQRLEIPCATGDIMVWFVVKSKQKITIFTHTAFSGPCDSRNCRSFGISASAAFHISLRSTPR